MRKMTTAVALGLAVALGTSACGGVGGSSSAGPAAAPAADQNITLTVWSGFQDRELKDVEAVFAKFHEAHPNITIKSQGGQDDDKITQAIRGGNAPDVAISFSADNIGKFCGSGSFQDLDPYISRDKVDMAQIPDATKSYTAYDGKRCAMPMLADVFGLYYNKKMFADAGITSPPKTMSEMAADAKKLTKLNADGSIKVAGYVPTPGYYANKAKILAPQFGAIWQDDKGKSSLAASPGWSEMLNWQKDLTGFYGAEKLTKFTAQSGQQYSPDHDFEIGRVAMILDGEYRAAFIDNEAKDLDYATAPFPVSDSHPELYGTAYTTGTIVGVPKGAKNAGAAWELIKYLTTDTAPLVQLSNSLKNVPTTIDAIKSPDLTASPQFKTFLDLFGDGKLVTSPASSNGGAYAKVFQDFALKYVNGDTTDLATGLKQVDQQIDDGAALGH
ncbi:sugar ABC transporter substrate-binding protein [Arthrobacter sp. ERGS1:01]|uniref:ABC transporter substrate-binding protein n=1 Tax=Arthrobacter sp. ERGS1:01 TaxID=1704044 RepID=UPI0006B577C4|nr:ABC transporter substrate-binding protein [Arthrobacter sp. ERGS1:01]ALE07271.1 sugar ABC transporter substrate-binding protein [Arthrobacter sp. ERGS1:01]